MSKRTSKAVKCIGHKRPVGCARCEGYRPDRCKPVAVRSADGFVTVLVLCKRHRSEEREQ